MLDRALILAQHAHGCVDRGHKTDPTCGAYADPAKAHQLTPYLDGKPDRLTSRILALQRNKNSKQGLIVDRQKLRWSWLQSLEDISSTNQYWSDIYDRVTDAVDEEECDEMLFAECLESFTYPRCVFQSFTVSSKTAARLSNIGGRSCTTMYCLVKAIRDEKVTILPAIVSHYSRFVWSTKDTTETVERRYGLVAFLELSLKHAHGQQYYAGSSSLIDEALDNCDLWALVWLRDIVQPLIKHEEDGIITLIPFLGKGVRRSNIGLEAL